MPDVSETEACDLLARLFRARGYSIQRNIPFREYGVEFHIDGWDAKNRIGFEFLSSEDDDHDDLSLEEYKTLNMAQQRGELSLFIIDEVEPLSTEELKSAAHEFLDEAAEAVIARQSRRPRKTTARKKASPKKAPPKKAARKTRTTKATVSKARASKKGRRTKAVAGSVREVAAATRGRGKKAATIKQGRRR